VQVTVLVLGLDVAVVWVQVPWVAVAALSWAPAGRVSVTTVPMAARRETPRFVANW